MSKNFGLEALAVAVYESHVREQREAHIGKFPPVISSWLTLTAAERDRWRDKAKGSAEEIEGRWSREFQGDF